MWINGERIRSSKRLRVLFWGILFNVIVSILHYVDNIVYLDQYPDPEWMTGHLIDAFWFVMTPFCIVGYLLFKKKRNALAAVCLCLYSMMSLFVLAHYLIEPIWSISLKINFLILLEALAAIILIVYVAMYQIGARQAAH